MILINTLVYKCKNGPKTIFSFGKKIEIIDLVKALEYGTPGITTPVN